MKAFKRTWQNNKTLGRYDIRFNNIGDDGVRSITEDSHETPHVCEINISEKVSKEVLQEFMEKLAANKPKKGKKKKGMGKKK